MFVLFRLTLNINAMTPGHIVYYTESVSKCHCIFNRTQAVVIEIANKCILCQLLGVSCGNKKNLYIFKSKFFSPQKYTSMIFFVGRVAVCHEMCTKT